MTDFTLVIWVVIVTLCDLDRVPEESELDETHPQREVDRPKDQPRDGEGELSLTLFAVIPEPDIPEEDGS